MVFIDEISFLPGAATTLRIAPGECVGVRGESGSGKTRLLRALADLDPHRGSVSVDGRSMTDMPAHRWRRRVTMLAAESGWWFDTVGEHFESFDVSFTRLGLDQAVMAWPVARCSSGEKQRLALLRVLQHRPRLLLLDEPTANLDDEATGRVEALIADYLAGERACAIWVTHSAAQLQRVSRRDYRMVAGRLVAENGDG